DERWLGEALRRLTGDTSLTRLARGSADDRIARDAHRILNAHRHDKIDSLTRARSTAFAASHVEMYMRSHGSRMPTIDDVGREDGRCSSRATSAVIAATAPTTDAATSSGRHGTSTSEPIAVASTS